MNRLPVGGHIDRKRPTRFTFNGKVYEGYYGDTLASALLANGLCLVARSLKYHRPRGIVSSGSEEPNAIVQVGQGARTLPNLIATQVELYQGLEAKSVNVSPSVEFDWRSIHGLFSRFMPPGFFYKTFMWPSSYWRRYEHQIRKAAGFGVAPSAPDPDDYDHINTQCDVLVIGGGPAGLSAARAAGKNGARVILVDERHKLGGSIHCRGTKLDEVSCDQWIDSVSKKLDTMENVKILNRTTVVGYYEHNFLLALERRTDHLPYEERSGPRQRMWRIRARQVILATGSVERPLVFSNNDRPGIMLASAVSDYVNCYSVIPGSRSVVFTNNDSAYQTAFDLVQAGVDVEIVDPRSPGEMSVQAVESGIKVFNNHVVVDTKGKKRIEGVYISALASDESKVANRPTTLNCDLLAMSGGWNPSVQLHAQSRGRPSYNERMACFVPGESVQAERSVGACNGSFLLDDCLLEGTQGGIEAALACGFGTGDGLELSISSSHNEVPVMEMWVVPSTKSVTRAPKQFVDFQTDVTAADILIAVREGYESIEHVKRYTTLGMGTDQGKLSSVNGIGILAKQLDADLGDIGTTTFRPMYTPVAYGVFAGGNKGERFDPIRKTPMHQWHVENGARFENVGQWKRAWYYPQTGESMDEAVNRECIATRTGAGVLDASTLGKIDIQGPDSAAFLNRIYTNPFLKLGMGRCRYGLMLDENGMVFDDGVTAKLSKDHYLMHTTTGGAAQVMAWLELWLQTEWPDLKVYLTSVTDHWATISISGPKSRSIIQTLCHDIDFSGESFPFMSVKEGTVAGVSSRIFRISFTGEMTYEINVDANYGRYVWEAVFDAGSSDFIVPIGTEAMHVLRAEKGYLIVGQDTDGSVTPMDLGMDRMIGKDNDFLGKRSLNRSYMLSGNRKQFVGLLTDDPQEVLPEGGQIVEDPTESLPRSMLGHVTSSYYSPVLAHSIALAMVQGGFSRMGEKVWIQHFDGTTTPATITDTTFYDPTGKRQHG